MTRLWVAGSTWRPLERGGKRRRLDSLAFNEAPVRARLFLILASEAILGKRLSVYSEMPPSSRHGEFGQSARTVWQKGYSLDGLHCLAGDFWFSMNKKGISQTPGTGRAKKARAT